MGYNESGAKRKVHIALCAYLKKPQTSHIRLFIAYLKALKQKEGSTPKRNRGKEVIKLKAEL